MRNRVAVLNVMIDIITMKEAVQVVEQFITQKEPHIVATANAEMVMLAQKDQELSQVLNGADLVVPDGAGVVWAIRHQGKKIMERVAGYDLTQELLARAAVKNYRVYLFGGAPGIAEKAKKMAEQRFVGSKIVGVRDGFTAKDEQQIIEDIRLAKPDILLVALGVPKQEKWLAKQAKQLHIPLMMGVGGTFDVMAGAVRRAPLWMQQMNLEWLYRLLSQPQRAIRMLALPRFVLCVLRGKKH